MDNLSIDTINGLLSSLDDDELYIFITQIKKRIDSIRQELKKDPRDINLGKQLKELRELLTLAHDTHEENFPMVSNVAIC